MFQKLGSQWSLRQSSKGCPEQTVVWATHKEGELCLLGPGQSHPLENAGTTDKEILRRLKGQLFIWGCLLQSPSKQSEYTAGRHIFKRKDFLIVYSK